ncbi:MAG: SAM-dependent methyltransferase [Actinomycetota bacterium]|nr:SAM-dependent methyltransferase [Actinomycetota bacterium]
MRKSSVYLPDALKRRLAARAEQTGRSEADLIRAAIDALLDERAPTPAPADPPVPGRLVGVGVGPGDPRLLTTAALVALRRADRVVAPCTAIDAVGRAEMIVREAAPDVVMERMRFVMAKDPAARAGAIDEACASLVGRLDAGEEVAFITLGDPMIYSTVGSVVSGVLARRPATTWDIVPGILAFQAVAAAGRMLLTDEQQSLVVLAANTGLDQLDRELADPTRTVVVYKGGGRLPAIAERLEAAGRLGGAVLGELVGLPGGRVTAVAAVADRPASYLSSIVVPATSHRSPAPGHRAGPGWEGPS